MSFSCQVRSTPNKIDEWSKQRWELDFNDILDGRKKIWRNKFMPRACTFCGSVNPIDALRLVIVDQWEVETETYDEPDAFIYPPGTIEYKDNMNDYESREIWIPIPPIRVFFVHFNVDQKRKLLTYVT